jgi:meso-butanediol dehydrogenase / (S,S)-butanediol dehydrogenase / diacetyl reductase
MGGLGGRFEGSAVLVTGAAHGIGRACAERLAAEGARVAVADLDGPAAADTVAGLGEGHLALTLDTADADAVDAAVAEAAGRLDRLDVLVNVVGGDEAHPGFEGTGDEVWTRLLDWNLMSVVRCSRAAVRYLRRSERSPAIVSVSSVNAFTAVGQAPYGAAKLAVVALTRDLAVELAPARIRVNAVAPGTIRTRIWDRQEGGADRMLPLYPLGRVGEPEDVAAAVAFLASSDAGWVTGHTLPVDGGLLTGHRDL